jgi:hypothetical protein
MERGRQSRATATPQAWHSAAGSVAALGLAVSLALGPAALSTPPNVIAIVEPIPGNVLTGHKDLEGIDIQVSHPESAQANPEFHPTAVASRIFPDNGKSDTAIDGGHASRDRWGLWSFQVQTTTYFDDALAEIGEGARIVNHSAGYTTSTTGNELRARLFDQMAYDHRTVVTQIAHNSGPNDGTLLDPAGAYNAIVIGASGRSEALPDADPFRGLAADAYVADYSSRGPTSDGRRKPDLIAPGTFVTLATYDPENPSQDGATKLTAGTSFAGPYVAGVAARLIEQADDRQWNSDPLTLKAILLNSAQEVSQQYALADGVYSPETWDGWSPTNTDKPLDLDQGAGEVSLPRAEWQYFTNPEQPANAVVARVGWDFEPALESGTTQWYYFERPVHAGATLTATLDWFREFDGVGTALGLDDLNLELWETDGVSPRSLVTQSNSAIDNVEHIHRFEVPDTAFYALAVNFKTSHSQGAADAFGLAWTLPDSPFLPGDANLDGRVDLADFGALKAFFGAGTLLEQGDFDLDRRVDLSDFGLLKENFGKSGARGSAVPEPPAAVLAALAAVACALWKRAFG